MLLLGSAILALTRETHAEQVPVKSQAVFRARHRYGGVIDTEKQSIALLLPARVAFLGRKIDEF